MQRAGASSFLELQGAALFATFIGVLITFAMWVSLWENVWQAAVEPTRGATRRYEERTGKKLRDRFRPVGLTGRPTKPPKPLGSIPKASGAGGSPTRMRGRNALRTVVPT